MVFKIEIPIKITKSIVRLYGVVDLVLVENYVLTE